MYRPQGLYDETKSLLIHEDCNTRTGFVRGSRADTVARRIRTASNRHWHCGGSPIGNAASGFMVCALEKDAIRAQTCGFGFQALDYRVDLTLRAERARASACCFQDRNFFKFRGRAKINLNLVWRNGRSCLTDQHVR